MPTIISNILFQTVDMQCKPDNCWGRRKESLMAKFIPMMGSTGEDVNTRLNATFDSTYRPVKNDPAELGLYTAQQLQLEEVLTQAIRAPVASAQAAETGVAAERQETRAFTTTQTTHETRRLQSQNSALFEPIS